MNLVIWLIAGGILGWLASLMLRNESEQGVLLNILVGIVGAALGGWLISPLIGFVSLSHESLDLGALAAALLGAVVLLVAAHLLRRIRRR